MVCWMDLPSAPVLDMRPLPVAGASSLPDDDTAACALASSDDGPSVKVAFTRPAKISVGRGRN